LAEPGKLCYDPHLVINSSQIRNPKQIQNQKSETRRLLFFGFGIWGFGFISNFEFRISTFLVLVGLFLVAGCEGRAPSQAPVSGKVFYQNQPLPRGTIVFVPDADRGNNGPLAQGSIQAGGSYAIQTEGKPGAMPGWYRVTVIAVESTSGGFSRGLSSAPRSLVPERYRDPQLSDLACEVKACQENGINFNLSP
jgi:hypothetical protein